MVIDLIVDLWGIAFRNPREHHVILRNRHAKKMSAKSSDLVMPQLQV